MIFFSIEATIGNPNVNRAKYMIDATCPRNTYGYSTGCLPIHVSIKKVATRVQNAACDRGRKDLDSFFDVFSMGIRKSTSIAATSAMTPPNFLGIERSIA